VLPIFDVLRTNLKLAGAWKAASCPHRNLIQSAELTRPFYASFVYVPRKCSYLMQKLHRGSFRRCAKGNVEWKFVKILPFVCVWSYVNFSIFYFSLIFFPSVHIYDSIFRICFLSVLYAFDHFASKHLSVYVYR